MKNPLGILQVATPDLAVTLAQTLLQMATLLPGPVPLCSWCPCGQEITGILRAAGISVTHTVCAECSRAMHMSGDFK